MRRKHFTFKEKLKYVKIALEEDFETALINFVVDQEKRYGFSWENETNYKKRKSKRPDRLGYQRIRIWIDKYNSLGERGLMNMSGKKKTGRPKKVGINDLHEEDREAYQEIVEELLREKGVRPKDIQEKLRKRKEKKRFKNFSKLADIFDVNRTSIYKPLKDKKPKKYFYNQEILIWMCLKIIESEYTIGRDKLWNTYKEYCKQNSVKPPKYRYFRNNFELMDYKSIAYKKNPARPPGEKKYRKVFAEDKVDFNFRSLYPNEKWFADISYLKLIDGWYHFHVITESYKNSVIAWSLKKYRNADLTLELFNEAAENAQATPTIFHTDHGVEYANKKFAKLLKENYIQQSMSPKGNSLANRPSEYFFGLIKREKLNQYNLELLTKKEVEKLISEYLIWYHYGRIQSCLGMNTPLQRTTEVY